MSSFQFRIRENNTMATPILTNRESWNSALKYLWGQYRTWDLTALALKQGVSHWRDIVLTLSIGGAVLGTLSQQTDAWKIVAMPAWLSTTLGVLGGAALGLAGYFTKELLNPAPEAKAIRARAAAEALKSNAYLMATGAPPYASATSADELLAKAREIRAGVEDLAPLATTSQQESEGMPSAPMSVDDYIRQRVVQQIEEFYLPKVRSNAKKLAMGRRLSVILGAVAVVLGLWSAKSASVAGWVAVIGVITAAIAARQYAERYQFLSVSYQATADRLKWLKTKWDLDGKTQTGPDAQSAFILACEDAISTENSAWMAEWTRKRGDQ
jgi:hypothetical protein